MFCFKRDCFRSGKLPGTACPGHSGGSVALQICGSPVCTLGACKDGLVLLDISELACLESPSNV